MWQSQYVTAQHLAGFRHYKYRAVDTNPLSIYVMQPLWDRLVKIVPLWIAPNLLSFTGFMMILINYFILSFYDWDYTTSGSSPGFIPTWVWIFCAFATFCAYALVEDIGPISVPELTFAGWESEELGQIVATRDSIDGKHARRTHSSTPLGELFDHGLDSCTVSMTALSFFSLCSRDNGKVGMSVSTMYLLLCIVLLNFILSHWEKYNTGVLFLPWVIDISHMVSTCTYLLTAALGMEIWHRPFIFGYYFRETLTFLIIVCCIFLSLPQTLYNIHIAYRKKKLLKDSLYEGLLPLLSPVLLVILLTTWVALSPCHILEKQTRLFFWMTGVMFSNITCRMIICQMTSTRSEVLNWLIVPLTLVVYTATAGFLGSLEEPILIAFTFFATAAHVHYGICVLKQLSQHFNIHIFSLKM
ncbi:ethanolaminephosphotransferase 1-like [Rhineura floridana]|uniref:ethanolaminephosphotransferase 1-like n=1 Tax=Rhineura floridana TaxID=261503 RepID=UPI002AC80FEB|nr:ethanolaminephosphotransferase 1-like [Rhineura floridana]